LEINLIREELEQRNKRAKEIKRLLAEEEATGRWGIVRSEIEELAKTFGKEQRNKRRTLIEQADDAEYTAEDFIVAEDNHVLISADGWVKRQKEINPETTRLREGDRVLSLVAGSTRATVVFFSNYGTAYSARIIDIPATTGYGEPIQKLFKLKDGEKIVAAVSLDDRVLPPKATRVDEKKPDTAPKLHGLAVTSDGYSLRFGLDTFREVSTRSGRRYARPAGGAEVTLAAVIGGDEIVIAASQKPSRDGLQDWRDQLPRRSGQRCASHQARQDRQAARRHHRDERSRHAHGQDQHGRRAAAEHRPLQSHRPRRQGSRVRQPRADRRSHL
jgi:DNA gyrase subunit A